MYTRYHPVFLDLNDRPVLIVGGGAVAVEKLNSLFGSGARLSVVSPEASDEIRAWAHDGRLEWAAKLFEEQDVEPAFMVIAATDDPALNAYVYECGNKRMRLTNSVDDPAHCNFIMAATAASGPIQVAISSAGCSPALAQRIRNQVRDDLLTEGIGELAEFLGSWRAEVKASLPTYRHRQWFWERVIDSHVPAVFHGQGRSMADLAMREAIDWARAHADCVGCRCPGFACQKEAR